MIEDQTLQNISEYVESLPQKVQGFITSEDWQKRTDEIALKYSLSNDQRDSLSNEVLFRLVGLDQSEDFTDTLVEQLGVSEIIAEQIIQDIEKRIFEFAIKEIEGRQPTSQNEEKEIHEEFLEVRPDITPMVEKGAKQNPVDFVARSSYDDSREVAHTTPKVSVPRYVVPENLPTETVVRQVEPVKPPVSTFVPPTPPKPVTNPEPEKVIEKKYVVDPYREPIE